MMTMEDKIKMYKGKKAFIKDISTAFEGKQVNSSVECIDYEVYYKEVVRGDITYQSFVEFVVVRFFGGGKSVKVVSGNSNTANFRVLGPMLDGGHYEENSYYDSMTETGYELVQLFANMKLDKLLSKPMTHISDVRACFNYCRNSEDVEKVIKMIPSVFGKFDVEYHYRSSEDDSTFVITNEYEENGDYQTEEAEYEFWEED